MASSLDGSAARGMTHSTATARPWQRKPRQVAWAGNGEKKKERASRNKDPEVKRWSMAVLSGGRRFLVRKPVVGRDRSRFPAHFPRRERQRQPRKARQVSRSREPNGTGSGRGPRAERGLPADPAPHEVVLLALQEPPPIDPCAPVAAISTGPAPRFDECVRA